MATNNYSLFPLTVIYAGPTTLNLRQIEDVGVQPNSQKSVIIPGGALDAGAVIENMADPLLRFSTRDLTALIGGVSITAGLYCNGGYTARFQKRTTGSTFATGGSHITATGASGFLNIESISANQDDERGAMASCSIAPLFDGTNDPIVFTNSVDLDADTTPLFNSAFFLGPAYLGSSELPGVIGIDVRPGIMWRPVRSAGLVYADQGSIVMRRPQIIFRTLDVSLVKGTMTRAFGNAFGSAIKVYFRKGVSGAARVADATTSHCKVTASTGDWTPDDISVRDNQDGTASVVVTPTGTIAVSVASAIP